MYIVYIMFHRASKNILSVHRRRQFDSSLFYCLATTVRKFWISGGFIGRRPVNVETSPNSVLVELDDMTSVVYYAEFHVATEEVI